MMSTCRWCTSVGPGASDLLQKYCSGSLSAEDEQAANDDLCFCLECVVEYHRARDELPSLHKRLWELETSRLLARFTQASEEELEEDDLLIVQDDQEIQVPKFTAAEYENFLRVPLTEILKYPYLLGHSTLCEMCVEALCKMENSNSFQVFDKYQGIYLLLVHPNETVRRWAIRAARSLGKVDRDDFYDLQDIFTSMFCVIQCDIFQDSDIDTSYDPEKGEMALLPRHLYDSTNYKNYWLGICMLLTVLDAQAMDSLLLGPDKQTDIIQCILNTMEKGEEDESMDPFWPSLQCFMVILDRLGSKVWGQQIEPASAFQAITGSPSYTTEIENIRCKTMMSKVKVERSCDDDMVTCSQIVYESDIKEKRKDSSIRSSASAESSSVIYEEIHSLVNVLQSDIGQGMRVHNSTFLWFFPFVESVMDLDDLSIVYTGEIIHYLCGGIKDVINGRIQTCDKVTEFFTLILVFIIELHLSKSRMNVLYYSVSNWVEVIVKCATLPCTAFPKGLDSGSNRVSSTSSLKSFYRKPQVSTVVPQACMLVIRSLLKEGGKLTLHSKSIQFLDMLNKQIREVSLKEWGLTVAEVKELQNCLKQIVKLMKDKSHKQATDRSLDALTPPPASNNAEPSYAENCCQTLKSEQRLISGQCSSNTIESRDCVDMKMGESHVISVKKEPNVTEENFESVSELRPCLQLTRMIPDPGKLQELKTKLSPSLFTKLQDIAKKPPDSRNIKVEKSSNGEQCTVETFTKEGPLSSISGCQEGPENLRPSTSVSERRATGTQMAQCVSEGSEYGDDVPLSTVKGFLKKSQKFKSLETPTDRGLNHLSIATCGKGHNGPFDSSPEVSGATERMEQKGNNKERTAQGNHGSHLKTVEPALDVIVISDSESGKEDDVICVSRKKIDRCGSEKFKIKSEPLDAADLQKSPIHGDLSDIDSQMFEFETQEDVFSAWNDHNISSNVPAQETKQELLSCNEQLVRPGPSDPNNTLGYETEPISDEIIENALLEVEAQLKKQKHSPEPQVSNAEKTEYFVIPKRLPSKASGKGSPSRKKKEKDSVKNKVFRSSEQNKKSYQEATSSKFASKLPTSSFATPAIVPPKKVRKPVEPTSAVEKLGLKKKERKAFDLSQRSLDCVDQLRKHGQGVQVEQKKPTSRNRKSRLISPQKLIVKGHKKLLASQELQFFRQSRKKPPSLLSVAASEQAIAKQCPDQIRKTNSKWNDILNPGVIEEEQDKDEFVFLPSLLPDSVVNYSKREKQADQTLQESRSTIEISLSESKQSSTTTTTVHTDPLYYGEQKPHNHGIVDDAKKHSANEVDGDSDLREDAEGDADMMNLTQMEPVDMEMCSQMEDDDFFLTQRDPVDMEIESESQINTEKSPWMDRLGEGQDKAVTPLMGSVVQKPSTSQQQDDNVFLKPGMSPLSCRKAKPSTTKIYAPSSRSATLVQEMEKTAKPPPPVAKNKMIRPVLPVRKSLPQPEFKQPHPVNRSVPIQIGTIGSSPHVPSYKTYARPETPVNKVTPVDSGYKFDQSVLINTILKWTYDMFCSYSQFGVPSDLCNLPLKEVGNSYKSYEEYFETFYPLLLINTFEELAKDWEKNTHSGKIITHHLKVNGIEYTNQIANASFTACLSERDVQHQLYPKEDDLVILWLPQNRSMYTCNEPELMEPRACFGCVSRSSVNPADERPTLNLSIQTRGNVSSVNNQAVKCQLMGSLVSAIREFRALYMLKNNTMFRPILAPQVTFFQPSQENILVKSLPEYNQEQVKAIKWGVSIVKRQQRSPKICLIHGPPGTGKSKTIVGLLQSLFSEENSAATVSRYSKACRRRVLLCAPSNAAVDNLMKKIILAFKENCRNIQNPLGNCGDINLVRLGMEKAISQNLKLFSLDSQTRIRTQKAQQGHDLDSVRRKQQLDQDIDNLSNMCAMVKKKNSDEFRKLTDQKCKLLKEREKLWRQLRETRSRKQETQARVLQDAHVICCTLSTSGSMVLESAFRRLGHEPFSCVIVDEARQATEPETLIPMLFRCPALILVGDPEQLPPTVVSQTAKEKKYDQSLMARLWKCLHRTAKENTHITVPVVLLNKQYRMHPDICQFPSVHIYNRTLETDCDTAQNRCAITWPFQPYRLFDVTDGYETKESESFCNHKEVKLVLILIKMILEKQNIKVGVITPYNAQKYRIQESINREMAKEELKRSQVVVDTVDGFQGREMDCIIVSCVRASSDSRSIGFLGNRQRMNVTITRAKYSLFILGHLRTLREHRDWGALIQDAVRRGTIIKTREKDFKMDSKQIFKPESGFMRSLSYPPKELGFPTLAKSNAEAPAFLSSEKYCAGSSSAASAGRAAPFRSHQGIDPPPVGVDTKGRSLAQLPSRPMTAERPRDPRLAVQPPHPRQDSGDRKERPHSSSSSLSRSMSREECRAPQHASREWDRRDSLPNLSYMSHNARGPQKRPSDGCSSSTSGKKVKSTGVQGEESDVPPASRHP
ncbi:probable helicase senataxin [Anguilla rostrata]|uniref:probable helicase senataxin n=1 Tax=Anguilla rostrata TaxID=7938 RepID=UPI0030CDF23D